MLFRLSFVTLILAVVALGTPVKRDAAQVELGVQKVDERSQSLDKSIEAFPNSGGTLAQVYKIHTEAEELKSLVETATNDANASAVFTDAQANTILEEMEKNLVPDVKKALADLVIKEPAVSAIKATSIAKSDLQDLKTATDAFGKALLAKTPAGMQSNVEKQFSTMDTEFTSAIKAYST